MTTVQIAQIHSQPDPMTCGGRTTRFSNASSTLDLACRQCHQQMPAPSARQTHLTHESRGHMLCFAHSTHTTSSSSRPSRIATSSNSTTTSSRKEGPQGPSLEFKACRRRACGTRNSVVWQQCWQICRPFPAHVLAALPHRGSWGLAAAFEADRRSFLAGGPWVQRDPRAALLPPLDRATRQSLRR
jgi:hypothetical protein